MRPLHFARRPLIGLDVDSSSIRMIQLRRRNAEYAVAGAAATDIAPWGDDRERQVINTIQAIRQCIETIGPSGKLAVCGLRGPEVVVRTFEFPNLPPEEAEGAVRLEASQMCPFSMEEGEIDHQVTSSSDNKTRGFWVAASRNMIENRRQLVHEAGLQCVLVDVDGLALLNCLDGLGERAPREADEGTDISDGLRTAVLDVGDSYATIAIADHARRPFVRDVSSAGHEITRHVARQIRVSTDEVRTALLGDPEHDDPAIQGSLEQACERLLDDVVTTLRYYVAQNHSVKVNKVLVCGRFAQAKGFIECLKSRLPAEVVPWNPVAAMDDEATPECKAVLRKAGPSMAIAVGLAMRTI